MLTTYELMIQELFGNLTPVSSQICLSSWFGSSTSKVLHWYRRGQGFENCSGRVSSFMQALFSKMPIISHTNLVEGINFTILCLREFVQQGAVYRLRSVLQW